MKSKGFTLIELLAVIVILAIIALIAVPIILNIIDSSKTSANQRSVELYGSAVENAVAKAQLNGEEISTGDLSREFLDKVQYNGSRVSCTTNKLYTNGEIYLSGCIVEGNKKEYTYGKEQEEVASKICQLASDSEKQEYEIGAKYTCSLDTDRTFYVLETSGDNVSLLMEQNFTDGDGTNGTIPPTVAWCTDGTDDNTTCKNINTTGSEAPEGKDYIGHITGVFNKKGVTVSFPTERQMKGIGCTEPQYNEDGDELASCPTWTYDYLGCIYNQVSGEFIISGYWLSSYSSYGAWSISTFGNLEEYSVVEGDYGDPRGLRPVITISKSLLD